MAVTDAQPKRRAGRPSDADRLEKVAENPKQGKLPFKNRFDSQVAHSQAIVTAHTLAPLASSGIERIEFVPSPHSSGVVAAIPPENGRGSSADAPAATATAQTPKMACYATKMAPR